MAIVARITDNPESVRIAVANYLGVCLKNAKRDTEAIFYLQRLDAFSTPYDAPGQTPLLLSIGRALFPE
jgi:hypothetical protein